MIDWSNPEHIKEPNRGHLCLVLCKVVGDNPAARKSTMPKEVHSYVCAGDCAPGDEFISVGFWNPDSAVDEFHNPDGWHVAGWKMDQDCWAGCRGFSVLGYYPLNPAVDGMTKEDWIGISSHINL